MLGKGALDAGGGTNSLIIDSGGGQLCGARPPDWPGGGPASQWQGVLAILRQDTHHTYGNIYMCIYIHTALQHNLWHTTTLKKQVDNWLRYKKEYKDLQAGGVGDILFLKSFIGGC